MVVAGALGRMGRTAVNALQSADGIYYAGGFARAASAKDNVVADLHTLLTAATPDVLLDLTTYPSSVDISMSALAHGVRPVVGTSGWREDDRLALDATARERGLGALVVPNFSIGALLMMHFARQAAAFFPSAELVELHHDGKKDAPSGTSLATRKAIAAGGGPPNAPIHSIRMRGLVAHQEVLFGTDGELLTIRHDSLSRESFVPGMLAAVRAVMNVRGLEIGLRIDAFGDVFHG